MTQSSFCLDLGDVSYPVHVGQRFAEHLRSKLECELQAGRYYFIFDEFIYQNLFKDNVAGDSFFEDKILIPARKGNKTFYAAMRVFSDLESRNISRDSVVVAIGGGVVGDLAGFVASCWYRGVKLVHVPTTLLSAVDSCVGGKTAINFKSTVNAVGTYHHPETIFIDTDLLLNLPAREISSGFAEIVKYAALGETEIERILESGSEINSETLAELVTYSLKCKARFVSNDIREGSKRLFLNFGHTIGHALEFSTIFNGEEQLRHGEGVALGMVAICHICKELGLLSEAEVQRMERLLTSVGLALRFPAAQVGLSREELIDRVASLAFKDKKRKQDALRLIVLNGWGRPEIYETSDWNLVSAGASRVIV